MSSKNDSNEVQLMYGITNDRMKKLLEDFKSVSSKELTLVGYNPSSIIMRVGYWEYPTKLESSIISESFDSIHIESFEDKDCGMLYQIEGVFKTRENLFLKTIKKLL